MEQFFEALKRHIEEHPLNFGDSNSVLTMLYECYSEIIPMTMSRSVRTSLNCTNR